MIHKHWIKDVPNMNPMNELWTLFRALFYRSIRTDSTTLCVKWDLLFGKIYYFFYSFPFRYNRSIWGCRSISSPFKYVCQSEPLLCFVILFVSWFDYTVDVWAWAHEQCFNSSLLFRLTAIMMIHWIQYSSCAYSTYST